MRNAAPRPTAKSLSGNLVGRHRHGRYPPPPRTRTLPGTPRPPSRREPPRPRLALRPGEIEPSSLDVDPWAPRDRELQGPNADRRGELGGGLARVSPVRRALGPPVRAKGCRRRRGAATDDPPGGLRGLGRRVASGCGGGDRHPGPRPTPPTGSGCPPERALRASRGGDVASGPERTVRGSLGPGSPGRAKERRRREIPRPATVAGSIVKPIRRDRALRAADPRRWRARPREGRPRAGGADRGKGSPPRKSYLNDPPLGRRLLRSEWSSTSWSSRTRQSPLPAP